jgi:hypothetical protein
VTVAMVSEVRVSWTGSLLMLDTAQTRKVKQCLYVFVSKN